MQELENVLRSTRDARGLSVAQLALRIGVSRQAIHDWERGLSKPSGMNCSKLADELGLDASYLMTLAGHQPGAPADDADLRARAEQFKAALRDVPRVFWPVVTDASIQLAKSMPVTTPPNDPITKPERDANRPTRRGRGRLTEPQSSATLVGAAA